MNLAFETLGCKVNQYESSHLLEAVEDAGYALVSFKEPADVYVVHSCAVTAKAGFETRQLLRRAQRLNPHATIVAMGCEAQRDHERLSQEGLATHILGNSHKLDLLHYLTLPATSEKPLIRVSDMRACTQFHLSPVKRMHRGRARAYLKVQDGCDAFCSYCIVPYTRGKSRSLTPEETACQMDRFVEGGYREVTLTGIHLGQWGKDLEPRLELVDLLRHLNRGKMPSRVRLSSLEPGEWSPPLLASLEHWKWLCPHFHVPLQSGSDQVLQRMERPYDTAQYEALLRLLRNLFPESALGADVLVGFPGETHEHFQTTLEFIESLPLTYLHVFPYSPRPGTKASQWQDRAAGRELKARAQALQKLAQEKRNRFQEAHKGKMLEILVESQCEPGWWRGTSGNYLQVFFSSPHPLLPGSLAEVLVKDMKNGSLMGELIHAHQ